MLCNTCRIENSTNACFCSQCGTEIIGNNQRVMNEANIESVEQEDSDTQECYEVALGYKNIEYYVAVFRKFDSEGVGVS